ncbi:hypothetical protein BV20DRAFT_1055006 [Pilatotrama ljubarskyi]|nr:hypothetical protein BV20DRAFT_1055006 [Pilatotrama ljubarskyi]
MSPYKSFATPDAPIYPMQGVLRFSSVQNLDTTAYSSPTRRALSRSGIQNSPPSSSRVSERDRPCEEDLVIFDMGIEDPEEEEQRTLYDSIPGFDEFLDADDSDEEPDQLSPLHQDALLSPDVYDQGAYLSGQGDDDEASSDSSEDMDVSRAALDQDRLQSDYIEAHRNGSDASVDSDCSSVVSDGEDAESEETTGDAYNASESGDSDTDSEDETGHIPDATWTSGAEKNPNIGSSHAKVLCSGRVKGSRASMLQDTLLMSSAATATSSKDLRRSSRIAKAACAKRRTREEWDASETDESCRAPPRKKVRKAAPPATENPPTAKIPTRGGQAAPDGVGSEGSGPHQTNVEGGPQKTARKGHIVDEFLQRLVVIETPKKACGVLGCSKELDLRDTAASRRHVREHHPEEERKAALVKCRWKGCTKNIQNGATAGGLTRHYDETHLRYRYTCPGGCKTTGRKGVERARTFARADQITRHETIDPCDYLKEHPIPRRSKKS